MGSIDKGKSIAKRLKRQDTRIESEGAEFLVLGQLLIRGIPAYKTYTHQPGYDLVVLNPDRHRSGRISVKSRWRTGAVNFLLKNKDCDFVIIAKLNRGSKDGNGKVYPPEYFILPIAVLEGVYESEGWHQIKFSSIPNFKTYQDRWDLIREFLERK